MSRVRVGVEVITPEDAARLLLGNHNNRPQKAGFITFLAREIREGRWAMTSSAISIAATGRILNGQHRLAAIAEAGIAVPVLVARGMDEESFLVEDRGNSRSLSDVTGLPPSLVADLSLIHNMTAFGQARNNRIPPQRMLDMASWWGPAYQFGVAAGAGDSRIKMNTAGFRVGMCLRWATARTAAERLYIAQSAQAILKSDLDTASKAARILWRRMTEAKAVGSWQDRAQRSVLVFVHLDMRRADREPLIRNMSESMDEVRQWLRMMEDAFLGGPDDENHPYFWAARPVVERTLSGAAAANVERKRQKGNAA